MVTGAAGYVGARLATRLIADPAFADARLTLTDLHTPPFADDERVRAVAADLARAADVAGLVGDGVDVVYHLAGILGGAAEADYALARRVNVDATLSLLEALRDADTPPRVVFASSIAVFGPPLPARIDDDTLPLPTMTYGAQKRMIEVALEQFSARGWIDGIALRLPGIVARADADTRLRSAFLNTLFFDYADGRDIMLPVSPGGTTWLLSVDACVEAFVHAGLLASDRLGTRRAMTLPAQHVEIRALVAALAARFPASPSRVGYAPDPALDAQFAAQPPLTTALADALGFRHDGDLATLVRRALSTRMSPPTG